MNDSPGWATPGSSPSDGERPGAPASQPTPPGAQPEQPGAQPPAAPGWSAEQPPPGQWSSPGTDGPAAPGSGPQQPRAGWGSYGGQQQPYGGQYGSPHGGPGGWNRPPAAKPGVIPLRPLGLGEILDGAVTTMRTHWRSVLSITFTVAVIVEIANVLFEKYAFADLTLDPETTTPGEVLDAAGGSMLLALVGIFVQLIGGILVTAMLTMIFSRAVLGQSSTVSGAWRDARPQLLRLCGLTLLMALGAILLVSVLVVPALLAGGPELAVLVGIGALVLVTWLWIKFSLAPPALMLEKAGIFTAFARSSKLVGGSWWRIFGISVLTAIITGIVSMIIVVPFTGIGAALFGGGMAGITDGTVSDSWGYLIISAIGTVIALGITLPMQAGVTVLLYIDQRIRREALDLELARAAGVENYGTTDGTGGPGPNHTTGG
ncbi:hypothetical protein [Streptomyces sp. NPDC090022]|uniref:hypothetical protein n=1 Tax=Streptomyces sp. NPDC090022 TaxID=3365920 RepID=UPI00382D88C6